MTKKSNHIKWEIAGNENGNININDEELKTLQSIIIEHKKKNGSPTNEEAHNMLGITAKMELYAMQPIQMIKDIKEPGFFIKEILKINNIKLINLAKYLGLNKTNFSALINGRRKINYDLALKLGNIFGIKPALWLQIQTKNELWLLENANKAEYQAYTLEGLMGATDR